MQTLSALTTPAARTDRSLVRPLPRYVTVSAWAVPVMVVGQFAFLAIVPVGLVLRGVLTTSPRRSLRWSALALAATYAAPLVALHTGNRR